MKNNLEIKVNCENSSPIVLINLNKMLLTKDITTFLSFYHLSRFRRGKWFLKRLLHRIFSKQLNEILNTYVFEKDSKKKSSTNKMRERLRNLGYY